MGDIWLWYLLYCLAISADVCACNFAGLECFLHFSIMLGVIVQITYHLTNIFVRHPRVSIFLPILDGMAAGALTPTYGVRRVFRRLSGQFVLSIPQVFPGFLDLDLKIK